MNEPSAPIGIGPRESVILAEEYDSLVAWYRDRLGFQPVSSHSEGYHYTMLESRGGVRVGIGVAKEMGVTPRDRKGATVLLQFEVEDVKAFLAHVEAAGGRVDFGPAFNEKDRFGYGAFSDPEGNGFWVVDSNCPL